MPSFYAHYVGMNLHTMDTIVNNINYTVDNESSMLGVMSWSIECILFFAFSLEIILLSNFLGFCLQILILNGVTVVLVPVFLFALLHACTYTKNLLNVSIC